MIIQNIPKMPDPMELLKSNPDLLRNFMPKNTDFSITFNPGIELSPEQKKEVIKAALKKVLELIE